jgi:hypothetical protein
MSELIKFGSADHWEDDVYIDPDDVSFVIPLHRDRDLGQYTTVEMKNGSRINLRGAISYVVEKIRENRTKGGEG